MLSALLSFLGGSAFRMLWGEVSHWITEARDHRREIERMRVQGELDAAQHSRNLEAIRVQAELGVQTIRVQGEADLSRLDALTFQKGVELTATTTGFRWIDAWNSAIRAAIATMCMWLILRHYAVLGWRLDDRGWELCGAALGLFIADRMLFRRGK